MYWEAWQAWGCAFLRPCDLLALMLYKFLFRDACQPHTVISEKTEIAGLMVPTPILWEWDLGLKFFPTFARILIPFIALATSSLLLRVMELCQSSRIGLAGFPEDMN